MVIDMHEVLFLYGSNSREVCFEPRSPEPRWAGGGVVYFEPREAWEMRPEPQDMDFEPRAVLGMRHDPWEVP